MPGRRTTPGRTSRAGIYRRPWPYYNRPRHKPQLQQTNRRDQAGADDITFSITESSALGKFIAKAGSDTIDFTVSESGFVGSPIDKGPGLDSINFSITESLVRSKPIDKAPGADSINFTITDTATRLTTVKALTVGDSIVLSIDEGEVVRKDKFGSDSIFFSITDTAVRQSLGPVVGTGILPPEPVPAGAVMGSVIAWDVDTPGTTTAMVETSVDGKATWQVATNGRPIPRLRGTTNVEEVWTRVTLTRADANDPSPVFHGRTILIDTDASTVETVPLGVFTLAETTIRDGAQGPELEITGYDPSRSISLNQWEQIFIIPAGTNWSDALQQAISNRRPGTIFNATSTAEVTPQLTFGSQGRNDPWQDFLDCAQAYGMELFFDARGVCVIRPEPDPQNGEPVWTFSDRSSQVITDVTRKIVDTDTFNYVIVTGENSTNTVAARGVAIDTDPTSPTYVQGPFGQRVYREQSSLVTSDSQALTMAQAILLRRRGATETVDLDVVPMSALEPGDIVALDRASMYLADNYMIDTMHVPFGADEQMRLTTRRQRVAASRPSGGGVGGLPGGPDTGGGDGGGTVPRTYSTPGECHKIGTNGNLNHFKLQTAFSGGSSIVEKTESDIGGGYNKSPEYCMNSGNTAVQMRVSENAPTTSGSSNPRSEYREMQSNGTTEASWTATSGDHWAQSTFRFTHLPNVKKSCSGMQVHDSDDDVIQILTRVIGGQLKLCYRLNGNDNDSWVLDNYTVGDEVTVRVEINAGVGKLWYHKGGDPTFSGSPNVTTGSGGIPSLSFSGGCYFKIGTYPQQTSSESSSDYAAAEFRKLGLVHPGYPAPVFDSDTVAGGGGAGTSFTMAVGACINASGSGAMVDIKNANPDYFAILGDVYYADGSSNHNSHWNAQFNESRYKAMLNNLPNPQIVGWSDHDFGFANNATGVGNSITATANSAYRTQFPGLSLPSNGIYRTWVVGRVRFILLDCLTFKDPLSKTDSPSKTMLGSTQKSWYKNLLSTATEPVIVVLGDGQMPGAKEAGQDEWRGYSYERDELASAVGGSSATVIYVNGDTHSLAYGHDQYGYARCWQSAPLHNNTKVKAGGDGYIETFPLNADEGDVMELYAILTFTDNGDSMDITYEGYQAGNSTPKLTDSITV